MIPILLSEYFMDPSLQFLVYKKLEAFCAYFEIFIHFGYHIFMTDMRMALSAPLGRFSSQIRAVGQKSAARDTGRS
jgi:hypothetical protein